MLSCTKLWFDVKLEQGTTLNNLKGTHARLWFDVKLEQGTTLKLWQGSYRSCGLM